VPEGEDDDLARLDTVVDVIAQPRQEQAPQARIPLRGRSRAYAGLLGEELNRCLEVVRDSARCGGPVVPPPACGSFNLCRGAA